MPNNDAVDVRTPVETSRATRLAALDHLRAWCDSEGAPAPTELTSSACITRADEVDEATRFAAVDAFAARHETVAKRGVHYYYANVDVYSGTAGVRITYYLFAEYDVERQL